VTYANEVDEKYLISNSDREVAEFEHYARENAKDIIATGLNPERTFIFSDYAYMGGDFYRNVTRIAKVCHFKHMQAYIANQSKRINRGTADACFGFTSSTSIGKVLKLHWPMLLDVNFP
jgi:tryptophanyl-tRNA synthetase